jgi:CHASE3 domain sensor protein
MIFLYVIIIGILSLITIGWIFLTKRINTSNNMISQNGHVLSEISNELSSTKGALVAGDRDLLRTMKIENEDQNQETAKLSKRVDGNYAEFQNTINLAKSIPGIMVGPSSLKTSAGNLLFEGPNELLVKGFSKFKVGDLMEVNTKDKNVRINGNLILNEADVDKSLENLKLYVDQRIDELMTTYQMSKSLSQPVIITDVVENFEDKDAVKNDIKNEIIKQINVELKPLLDNRDKEVQKALLQHMDGKINSVVDKIKITESDAKKFMDSIGKQLDTHSSGINNQLKDQYSRFDNKVDKKSSEMTNNLQKTSSEIKGDVQRNLSEMSKKVENDYLKLDNKYANELKNLDGRVDDMVNSIVSLSQKEHKIPTDYIREVTYNTDKKMFNDRAISLEEKIDTIQGQIGSVIVNAQKIADGANKDNTVRLNLDVTGKFTAAGESVFKGKTAFERPLEVNNKEGIQAGPVDWLRVRGAKANGTAMYNGVSINENGGLNVGKWGRVPTGEIHASNRVNVGNTSIDSATIHNKGRQHIHPQERLYVLPKGGTHITGDWGADPTINMQSFVDPKNPKNNKTAKVCIDNSCMDAADIRKMNAKNVKVEGVIEIPNGDKAHPDNNGNYIYTADGQLQIATDDVIRLRNSTTKDTGIQMDTRRGAGDIQNPNGQMKISRQGIMFGGPNNGKEVNSAQISAGLHQPNSLNIVGMSSGKGAGDRRVDMWAEGGLHVHGSVNSHNINAGHTKTSKLRLGDKFVLSGVGDAHANDGWLRLFGADEKGYHGGLAAGNLWSGSDVSAAGTINAGKISLHNNNNKDDNVHINIHQHNPGTMIEKRYGTNKGDRYGMGQYPGGNTRVYSAKDYGPSSVNLGFAKKDGGFDDVLKVQNTNDGGQVFINATGNIQNPNGQMKISRQGIMFGGPNNGKEVNSAQISAGLHQPNSLNIVGMSSGKGHQDRRVDMWAEGGLHVHGSVNSHNINAGHTKTSKLRLGDKFVLSGVGDGHANDGWLRLFGANEKDYNGGLAAGNLYSHNDILAPRGTVFAKKLCIDNVCIDANHLRMLTEGFHIQTGANGHHNGRMIHTHGDGVMRQADHKYRTWYKMVR